MLTWRQHSAKARRELRRHFDHLDVSPGRLGLVCRSHLNSVHGSEVRLGWIVLESARMPLPDA